MVRSQPGQKFPQDPISISNCHPNLQLRLRSGGSWFPGQTGQKFMRSHLNGEKKKKTRYSGSPIILAMEGSLQYKDHGPRPPEQKSKTPYLKQQEQKRT
jgi:hypothetical protein